MINYRWETVADRLASDGYVIIDQFLSEEQVYAFHTQVGSLYDKGTFKKAGIGHQQDFTKDEAVRGDHIFWLSEHTQEPLIQGFWQKMDHFVEYLNATCFLGIKSREFHFAVYPVGKFYRRHLDVFKDSDARKISVIIYLNPEWRPEWGGALRLFLENQELDILPQGGRMVCMRSELIEHAVLPVIRERFSLTGWLRTDEKLF